MSSKYEEKIGTPYSAKAIANEFLRIAKESGQTLTPMKLQKLLYFAHGWFLAFTEKPLLNEQIEAWRYGPVIESVYHELKRFGPGPIEDMCSEDVLGQTHYPIVPSDDEQTLAHLKEVWRAYGNLSALQLSSMTHVDGGPWDSANKANSQKLKNWTISNDTMREYFKGVLSQGAESNARAGQDTAN